MKSFSFALIPVLFVLFFAGEGKKKPQVPNKPQDVSPLLISEKIPSTEVTSVSGEPESFTSIVKQKKSVVLFYRGGWCPYCNINLHYLQEELLNFKKEGANLIALTPELPDKSISTKEKNELEFEVLSDVGNKVALEYGVVFTLTDEVAEIYNKKFDLISHNGNDSNELPLAVTYIINTDGKIEYAFLDVDYRNRAEPKEITTFLKKMKQK
mgnify:CR=1 FL=1